VPPLSPRFAEKLVAVLNKVVPDDVALGVLPWGGIRIVAGDEHEGVVELYGYPTWPGEPPESFARLLLRNVQDQVVEWSVGHDWPGLPPGVPEPPPGVPLREPDAEVVNGELHWWYGDRNTPVLILPPVQLADRERE
jgi:hypothetical protein